jgi:hypothetical protein
LGTPNISGTHHRIVELEVELPFTTAEIVPLRRRKPLPECVYPKIRKAAK